MKRGGDGDDHLALDGLGELEPGTLFFVGAPAVAPVPDLPRVFDDDGKERCPGCNSELARRHCPRCDRLGITAPPLVLVPLQSG